MNETIKTIELRKLDHEVIINTDKKGMEFSIDSSYQSCCEWCGIDISIDGENFPMENIRMGKEKEKEKEYFSNLIISLNDKLVGKKINKCSILAIPVKHDVYEQNVTIKLDLESDDETTHCMLIKIYNEHNGYYPHDAKVKWEGFEDSYEL